VEKRKKNILICGASSSSFSTVSKDGFHPTNLLLSPEGLNIESDAFSCPPKKALSGS
jgi:hypothetical protein